MFLKLRKKGGEKGQSATEYMLVIAVIVIGLVAAGSKLIPKFRDGVEKLGGNLSDYLEAKQSVEKGDGG